MLLNPSSSSDFVAKARACVLAGGRSSRMGQDKAELVIGGETMLVRICRAAAAAGLDCDVLREDDVVPCGPIGGVITAFARHPEPVLVFLSCDMPFVSPELLGRITLVALAEGSVFVEDGGRFGFPFALRRSDLTAVSRRHAEGAYSLQGLVREIQGRSALSRLPARELFNVNSPDDLNHARALA